MNLSKKENINKKIKRLEIYLERIKKRGKECWSCFFLCGYTIPPKTIDIFIEVLISEIEKEINRLKEELGSVEIIIKEDCNEKVE